MYVTKNLPKLRFYLSATKLEGKTKEQLSSGGFFKRERS